jgi:hypothetical protein
LGLFIGLRLGAREFRLQSLWLSDDRFPAIRLN